MFEAIIHTFVSGHDGLFEYFCYDNSLLWVGGKQHIDGVVLCHVHVHLHVETQ